jgi:hypothetical protein
MAREKRRTISLNLAALANPKSQRRVLRNSKLEIAKTGRFLRFLKNGVPF